MSKDSSFDGFSPLQKIALVKGLLAFRAEVLLGTGNKFDANVMGSWSDILDEALKDIGFQDGS